MNDKKEKNEGHKERRNKKSIMNHIQIEQTKIIMIFVPIH